MTAQRSSRNFEQPHPLDGPPWYDGAESVVPGWLEHFVSEGWNDPSLTPTTLATSNAVYCRGPNVVRVLRAEIEGRFGRRTLRVRKPGGMTTEPAGDVKTWPGQSNVAAVPPGLLALARTAMTREYGAVEHGRSSDVDLLDPHPLHDSRELLRQDGDAGGVRQINELLAGGGGQFVAAGESVRHRAEAVAGVLRLARKGPSVVIAGTGERADDYAAALKKLLPKEAGFRFHANPFSAVWYRPAATDDAGDETREEFGDGDVAVVATGISPGVPDRPTVAVFVDSDLAAAELEIDGDETLRGEPGTWSEDRACNIVDHPGSTIPYWRRIGAVPVGVLSPEQREAAPVAVQLFREATLGPILAWIAPPAPKSPPVTVAAAEVDAEDSQAVADAVRAACGPDGPDAPTAAVVAKDRSSAAALATELGWPLLPVQPSPGNPAAPVPRAVITLVAERRRKALPWVDVLVWAAGGVDGPAKERLRRGGLVVDCLDAHADRRRAALADRGWGRTAFSLSDPPHRPPDPASAAPGGGAGRGTTSP